MKSYILSRLRDKRLIVMFKRFLKKTIHKSSEYILLKLTEVWFKIKRYCHNIQREFCFMLECFPAFITFQNLSLRANDYLPKICFILQQYANECY